MSRKARKAMLTMAPALAAALAFSLQAAPARAQVPANAAPKVSTAVKFQRTQPLRDLRWNLPPVMQRILHYQTGPITQARLKALHQQLVQSGRLPLTSEVQTPAARASASRLTVPAASGTAGGFTQPTLSFDGLGASTGLNIQSPIPDAKAAVGEKYLIEAVNAVFAIYDKATGDMILGPVPLNALWTGFGGPCERLDSGYPAVVYDQLAHRWIISQYALPASSLITARYQCVAVSQTNDPTGAWYLYAFEITDHAMRGSFSPAATSPAMAVWPDAWYAASPYQYQPPFGYTISGTLFSAFDRAAMLAGDPDAQAVTFDRPRSVIAALPASLDGMTPPPVGAPGLFAEYTKGGLFRPIQELALFQLHVDWTDPSGATLTGPTAIPINPFNEVCPAASYQSTRSPDCLLQPRSPQKLDALGDRLMARLAYRNFGDHQVLVVNQTVGVDSSGNPPSGIRWYELDAPAGAIAPAAWTVAQQGTYAPADGASRWLGSIAMDNDGNVALGYSLVGPDTDPSIAYTGRHSADPAGEMTETETILQAGGGDQMGSNLWGDASTMAVAPDGCTFWYTNEYYATSSAAYWSTHIGAFKFPDCGSAPQGRLEGTVTDAASGRPIAGVRVIVMPGDIVAETDEQGRYGLKLAAGDYTLTAGIFGYAPGGASATVTDGGVAGEDFQLSAAATATVSGHVTDGSGHGWPLYAEIKVFTPGFGQVGDVWTDPKTGAYSVNLSEGSAYTLRVFAYQKSYKPGEVTIADLSGAETEDFALKIDGSCTTPGYYSFKINQNFNGTFPPAGWTVTNEVTGSPVVWKLNTQWFNPLNGVVDGNFTGGSGSAAAIDSIDAPGDSPSGQYLGDFDSSMISPPFAVSSLPGTPVLRFLMNYQGIPSTELDLDIRADGGAWQNIAQYTTQRYGVYFAPPGVTQTFALASHIPAGAKTIQLRWHYYFIPGMHYTNGVYAQVDDVRIGRCSLIPGGLIEGQVSDANTSDGIVGATVADGRGDQVQTIANTADPNLPAGYYRLFAPAGKNTLIVSALGYQAGEKTVTVAADEVTQGNVVLGAGHIVNDPASLDVHVTVNGEHTEILSLDNIGGAAGHYEVAEANRPMPPSTAAGQAVATALPALPGSGLSAAPFKTTLCLPGAGSSCGRQNAPWLSTAGTAAAGGEPGTLVNTFFTYLQGTYSLGFDRDAGKLWVGTSSLQGGGDKDHQFLPNGTPTGAIMDVSGISSQGYEADMAYDSNTGTFWQIGISLTNGFCIFELDPVAMQTTGRRICPDIDIFQMALAYDPTTNTWYSGDFNTHAIYHFDASGRVLDWAPDTQGAPIIGLTYNPGTGHLFAVMSGALPNVGVFDIRHGYQLLGTFSVPGLYGLAGAGLSHDCAGHLWIASIYNNEVFEADSGEDGWCDFKQVPWLSEAPAGGTVQAGSAATVALAFDGAGRKPFSEAHTQIMVRSNTPYGLIRVPVTVHWDPQPVDLVLTGAASPSPVKLGNGLVYTLAIENAVAEGHGSASETTLSYQLPEGVNFVSAGGGGASCRVSSGVVICDLGVIAEGVSKALTIAVDTQQAGSLTSTFEVSAREPDSDTSSNSLTLSTSVLGTANLKLSVANASVAEGGSATLHFDLTNAGPDAATDMKVKFDVQGGVKLMSATATQGSCEPSGFSTLTCDIGQLAADGEIGVDVTVFGTYAGTATVTGQVTTTATDPEDGNDVAQAAVSITAGGGGDDGGNGGGGGFGWLALTALLGLAAFAILMRKYRMRLIWRRNIMGRRAMRRGRAAAISALALTLGVGAALPAWAQEAPASHPAMVKMVPQSSLLLLSRATELGPHARNAGISLIFGLKLRHADQLKHFLHEVQDPRSPLYHRFLTPAEFTARYGPTPAQVAKLEIYLRGRGITVTDVSPNRLLVHARGKTEAFEHALEIRINDYRLDGRSFYSTEDRPRLPADIAPLVVNVLGLNHGLEMRPLSRLRARYETGGPHAAPPASTAYFNPHQIAKAYDWPDITDSDNGAGVSIAIMTAETPNVETNPNYHAFWSAFGLPDHTINAIAVGGSSGSGGEVESALDIEWSGAMAPGADLNVYVAADALLTTFATAYNQIVNDTNPDGTPKNQVMTTSWGLAEHAAPALFKSDEQIFMQGAAEGISMFAAAGDHSASDCAPSPGYCPPGPNNADFPSSSEYVTAANGTELDISDTSGTYGSERASIYTGGAISELFDKPAWQTGSGVPSDVAMRMNSDMAMNYGSVHPYLVVVTGSQGQGFYGIGGTSAVAPQLAAMFAVGVSKNGGVSLGQSNKLIYDDVNANDANYASDFHDVTSGCNGDLPDGAPSCAGTDWDHPTGWGSPKAASLLSHLGIQGPRGTLTGTVTDAASGTPVANAQVSATPGVRGGPTDDQGQYSFDLPVGDYTVTVTEFGYVDGTASISISDGATTTQDFQLQPAPTVTVSGHVTDGSGHGWGLYAEVVASVEGFGQVADVWTDPTTGAYSFQVPGGYDYTLAVTPYFDYNPATATVHVSGDTVQDFALVTPACSAPGYHFQGLSEDFNAGPFPPTGWTVTLPTEFHNPFLKWLYNKYPPGVSGGGRWNDDNFTGGSGSSADVNASVEGSNWGSRYDTSLVSPPIDVSGDASNLKLSFKLNYQHVTGDELDLDINVDGQGWTTVKRFDTNQGAFFDTPGVPVSVDLAGLVPANANSVQLRWRYYKPNPGDVGWYAQVDDVRVGACSMLAGGLIMGRVTDKNTGIGLVGATVSNDAGGITRTIVNARDPNLPSGYYMSFIPGGKHVLTASALAYRNDEETVNVGANDVKVEDFALSAGRLAGDPASLDVHVTVGGDRDTLFNLLNTGSALAHYRVLEANQPVSPQTGAGQAAVISSAAGRVSATSNASGEPFRAIRCNTDRGCMRHGSAPAAATVSGPGSVVSTFATGLRGLYGLGVNRDAGNLWAGSISLNGGGGDDRDHQFLFDGTATGKSVDISGFSPGGYEADMAYDDNTGMLWQIGSEKPSEFCIHEIDPATASLTGRQICPDIPFYQSALAYDPLTDTWYSGDLNTGAIYHFDAAGRVLDWKNVGVQVIGLTFNPATGHLFATASVNTYDVFVIDPKDGYRILSTFNIPGMDGLAGAGLGHDCDDHLWVTRYGSNEVFEVKSGESGWCAFKAIHWLGIAPANGSVAAGAQAPITFSIDGMGQEPFTSTHTQVVVRGDTPYPVLRVPVTVHWDPKPVDLVLTGSVAPQRVDKGNNVTYTLTVQNASAAGQGPATRTVLSYALPAGANYISGSSGGVSCAAPAAGSAASSALVKCALGGLAAGASKSVTIAVAADQAGTLASTFTVSAREPDSDEGSNTLTLDSTVIGTADLGVSVTDASLKEGSYGTAQVEVTNGGPDTATDVVLELSAGGEAKLVSVASSQGSCEPVNGNGFRCMLGDLAAGASATVNLKVFGVYAGSATLTGQASTSAVDKNQNNDLGTAIVTVTESGGGNGGNGGAGDSGGGGALGWFALVALLGFALGAGLKRRHG